MFVRDPIRVFYPCKFSGGTVCRIWFAFSVFCKQSCSFCTFPIYLLINVLTGIIPAPDFVCKAEL